MPRSLIQTLHPVRWWLATALVLLAGYADLVRGGVTVAPLLLVTSYCVLAPIAILRR
ncbi:MAG TPA: hypothetical protein VHQ45_13290 [Gemmatimonadaceae bacterium]|nr:hypothetical protein [Gemmatimonadaceae bacterium]